MFQISARPERRYQDLVLPHVAFLYRLARRYTHTTYDAEDVVQETCYLALKNIHQLRDTSQVKGWLARILRNAFLRTLRPNKRMHTEEWIEEESEDVWRTAPESANVSHDRRDYICKLVDGLQEHYKSALLLHTVGGMTYEQIAGVLDIPIGTVMSRISRAKRLLRARVTALEKDARDKANPNRVHPHLQVLPGGQVEDTKSMKESAS